MPVRWNDRAALASEVEGKSVEHGATARAASYYVLPGIRRWTMKESGRSLGCCQVSQGLAAGIRSAPGQETHPCTDWTCTLPHFLRRCHSHPRRRSLLILTIGAGAGAGADGQGQPFPPPSRVVSHQTRLVRRDDGRESHCESAIHLPNLAHPRV